MNPKQKQNLEAVRERIAQIVGDSDLTLIESALARCGAAKYAPSSYSDQDLAFAIRQAVEEAESEAKATDSDKPAVEIARERLGDEAYEAMPPLRRLQTVQRIEREQSSEEPVKPKLKDNPSPIDKLKFANKASPTVEADEDNQDSAIAPDLSPRRKLEAINNNQAKRRAIRQIRSYEKGMADFEPVLRSYAQSEIARLKNVHDID